MKKKISSILYWILALAVGLSACAKEEAVYLEQEEPVSEATEIITPDTESEPAFCCVYVCGAVKIPGVYSLGMDARVCDAVEAAGGFAEDAATEAVNLARKISDAEQIWIPTVAEVENQQITGVGEAKLALPPGTAEGVDSSGKVNLNTATIEELMTIPGIGEAKAGDIIAYRSEHGGFTDVKDIMNIAGIKEGIFEKIKDSITIN